MGASEYRIKAKKIINKPFVVVPVMETKSFYRPERSAWRNLANMKPNEESNAVQTGNGIPPKGSVASRPRHVGNEILSG